MCGTPLTLTCSKSTIEPLQKGVKYVQSHISPFSIGSIVDFEQVNVSSERITFTFLTHFMSLVSFYTPWKYQKTSDFRGDRKRHVAWNGLMKF